MLDALVQYAKDAEFSKMLPPTGFYDYSQPIRWVVQISEDGARLEESNLEGLRWSRPYTGRTSGIDPHPLADETSYALGVAVDDKGKLDHRVAEKHTSFVGLLDKMLTAPEIGLDLRQAIQQVKTAIENKWIESDPRFSEVMAKDWVAFQLEYGPLAGKRLFQLPEAQAFWVAEAQERIAVRDSDQKVILGECAVCGENKPLISRIPVGVKLISKPGPLHSLNKSAFVSGRSGTDGHNNLCYECADTASRSFNALSGDKNHRRIIVMDKSAGGKVQLDSLRNQVALFWIDRAPSSLSSTSESFEFDFESAFGDLLRPEARDELGSSEEGVVLDLAPLKGKAKQGEVTLPKGQTRLSQLSNFLNVQWKAQKHLTQLDGSKFALAVFSPNVGRTALREWMYRDLSAVIPQVQAYLNATTINDAWGAPGEPKSINALMQAIDSKNANLTRDLIRTAYQGTPPPREMLALAVQRYCTLTVKGKQEKKLEEWQRQRHLHALAAILKLSLYYDAIKTEGGETFMTGLDKFANDPAYLCGRLLAVLEEAQQVYSYRQNRKRLKTTGVQRSFGAASAAPAGIFPSLVKLATVAHLPKAGKGLNVEMETLVAQIVAQGGYPQTMSVDAQGKFGLGYWHQRGNIRTSWSQEQKEADTRAEQDIEGDDA